MIKKETKTIEIATQITNFFENQGLMLHNDTRKTVIRKIANVISDAFEEKETKINEMGLKYLYNPENITSVLIDKLGVVMPNKNQGFQIYYNKNGGIRKVELWECKNGFLYKLQGWTTRVISTYKS